MESAQSVGESHTESRNPWQLLLGLGLGIATVANPLGAFYWGLSFVPPLLLGFALYVPRRTRTVGIGALAAGVGFSVFVGTAMLLLLVMPAAS
ncbi:hypothetical protein M2272_003054 [Mycobacterium frederiksbergense]|uniref:DUF4190 domain-containing protein n=1 Tax=Mycolicibacterium frederiksbergense TaxID=117567 RepID=A0ABT6L1E7_9MYCO|nr:hypothetical protein [Mycolicibacterium frederiksbergense]MDH6196411.1 hypothetical protein [Mycolicibacterium frederiksbergense]